MFYKPTYCSNCGDKIERIEWRLLTSRRFCELCETEFKFDDWFPRIAGILALLIGVWGIGSYFSSSAESLRISNPRALAGSEIERKNTSNPLASKRSSKSAGANKRKDIGKTDAKAQKSVPHSEDRAPAISETVSPPPAKRIETERVAIEASEPVYFCGAATKKGRPCSRKVKGKKRCWQHKGRDAMLPQDKLAVGVGN
ncbi:MAG: hypothetical protein HKN25_14590 [Pyrinomonadaceae bacterium]|nr:hypothetical protein [Pyrinomonadaceae bacterium]